MSEFEANRSANWRETLDENGIPTQAPQRCDHGCHYCLGPLDAKPEIGQYECPWCIARFPEPKPRRCSACGGDEDKSVDPQTDRFVRELRPFGVGGALVCFPCGMADIETTEAHVAKQLDSAPVTLLTDEGPVPFDPRMQGDES